MAFGGQQVLEPGAKLIQKEETNFTGSVGGPGNLQGAQPEGRRGQVEDLSARRHVWPLDKDHVLET